jgi:hypothetical protein
MSEALTIEAAKAIPDAPRMAFNWRILIPLASLGLALLVHLNWPALAN